MASSSSSAGSSDELYPNNVSEMPEESYSAAAALSTASSSSISHKDRAGYLPLYVAALQGDWNTAKEIFNKDKSALTAKLNIENNTALHVAVGTGKNNNFVVNLLEEINPNSLPSLVSDSGRNAVHLAAQVGNTTAARMLVGKNQHLLFMVDEQGYLPIHTAILVPHEDTFLYLLKVSKIHIGLSQQDGYYSPFEGLNGAVLLNSVIDAGLFDVAYDLIKEYPDMARANVKNPPLFAIANKSDTYYSGTRYNCYQRFVYSHVPIENNRIGNTENAIDIENQVTHNAKVVTKSRSCFHRVIQRMNVKFWNIILLHVLHIKRLQKDKVKHKKAIILLKCISNEVRKLDSETDHIGHYSDATTHATINDIPEVVEEIVESFPDAITATHKDNYLIQLAIVNRCEKVYNLLAHQMSDNKYIYKLVTDKYGNNLLHLAGQIAPRHKLNMVSGAALQMQRELQWFQEVEKYVLPRHKGEKNKKQKTPIMVFRERHKDLRREGEAWMKKTADSYTITAALIITVVFAAAITVPGGNENTGEPIYTKRIGFIIFAVADAILLFTSTTSLLLSLSILTSRYAENDFLKTLPQRLIFGLVMLFLSVTSMLVAFSATLYLMFGRGKAWIVIPTALLTCLPIASFAGLQFPLLRDLITSTYGRGTFGKQSDRRIY